jgi:hypothetical protein
MQPNRTVTLCPECGACPEINLYDSEVTIGEEGNMVKLKTDEWNAIVDKILGGEIGKV